MKKLLFIFSLCLCINQNLMAQLATVDVALNAQTKLSNTTQIQNLVEVRKKSIVDKLHQAKLIQETINIINTMRDVKNVVGTVSATVGDLKSVTQQFYQDFRGLESVSKDEISRLQELMSFRDALEGRGYKSIFGAYDWYVDETARFRDRNGHMNIASAILNESDPERGLAVYRTFQSSYFNMRKERLKCDDMSILEDLAFARYYERQARLLTIIYNIAAFQTSTNNLLAKYGGGIKELSISKNDKKYTLTPEGMLELRAHIESALELGAQRRTDAFNKYNKFIAAQSTQIELAYMLQKVRAINKGDAERKEAYLNGESQTNAATYHGDWNADRSNW